MKKQFQKELLGEIQWITNTCNGWAINALCSEKDGEILRDLDEVRFWAKRIMQKVEQYKQWWKEDNQKNEKQEDVKF